jgi:hypothetical protein
MHLGCIKFRDYLEALSKHDDDSDDSLATNLFILSFMYSSMALEPFVGSWPLLQLRNLLYPVGRTPWTSDQFVARPLPAHRTIQTQNKYTQTSIHSLGFETMISAFELAKTVHASGRSVTEIGEYNC